MKTPDFVEFLLRAKKSTYAAGMALAGSSRPGSHDLSFSQPPYLYIDTYLGGFHFIGEEAVWQSGRNIWGMNYYGRMLDAEIPAGFSQFLKTALMLVPAAAPFRGPTEFIGSGFQYLCAHTGDLCCFSGREEIRNGNKTIYELFFHGGEIRD